MEISGTDTSCITDSQGATIAAGAVEDHRVAQMHKKVNEREKHKKTRKL